MRRGEDLFLHLTAPPTNASLPPLNPCQALGLHPPLLSMCCLESSLPTVLHALSLLTWDL